ncbi:MAG TPA: glycosyltransferase family 39 protein [Methylophilaceae bacterium]|nr:glycosyltransferase family 39 protein [Methylophilaceae bacterium]
MAFLERLPWNARLLAITALAFAISAVGIAWLPLEAHEAFVLLAAQHMLDSRDWVIPYFNGEPHLTKPPLNYWLTLIIAKACSASQIQAWHGRLVSALSGTGSVFITGWAGKKLFDEKTGLLSALMLATCTGFFYYSHSARPEMLYMLLCNIAVLAYILMRDGDIKPRRQLLLAGTIWLVFALATLTKGPHIPAVLLVAFVLDQYWLKGNIRQAIALLRPLPGLALAILIAAPWWWLLNHRLGGQGTHGTQLSGSLLTINPLHLLSPYYLYRPLQLLLPWVLLLPLLWHAFRKPEYKNQRRLLLLLIVLPALVLSLGPQKRWYYMLPSMMPMCLLLSAGIVAYLSRHPSGGVRLKLLAAFSILCGALFLAAGRSQWAWGPQRFDQAKLAQTLNENLTPDSRILNWNVTPEIFAFYTHRDIIRVHNIDDIRKQLRLKNKAGNLLLIMDTKYMAQLPAELDAKLLGQTPGVKKDNAPITLVSINATE